MKSKLFTILRIVVSVGLIFWVCTKIQLNDALVKADGTRITGRLIAGQTGPEVFGLTTPDGGTVTLDSSQLQKDKENRLTGVQRGLITVFRDLNLLWFIPTFLVMGIIPVIGAVRFRWLLAVQGVHISLGRSLSLTFMGFFFSNFMLGLTGGDVVKAYLIARETHKRTEAIVTVFLDRIVGLLALALLAALMVGINFRDPRFAHAAIYVWVFLIGAIFVTLTLYSSVLRRKVYYTIFGVVALGGGFLLMWRAHEAHWDWTAVRLETAAYIIGLVGVGFFAFIRPLRLLFRMDRIRIWLAGNKLVREMDATFSTLSREPRTSVLSLLVSFACHLTTILGVYGFARSLGIHVAPHYFFVFIPVIVMIAAIPVSVSGWGVQEAVFQVFFGTVGVSATEAVTLSFVYRLGFAILWSLPGGLALMLSKDRASAKEAEKALAQPEGEA